MAKMYPERQAIFRITFHISGYIRLCYSNKWHQYLKVLKKIISTSITCSVQVWGECLLCTSNINPEIYTNAVLSHNPEKKRSEIFVAALKTSTASLMSCLSAFVDSIQKHTITQPKVCLKWKRLTIPNVGEDLKQPEFSYTVLVRV